LPTVYLFYYFQDKQRLFRLTSLTRLFS
jgi:hypothetical protein